MSKPAVEAHGLRKAFSQVQALDGLSLAVPTAVGTAVGLSGDLRTGILVRFRTLPMARIAVLGGRTVADLARNLLVVAIMTGVGFAAGFRALVNAERALILGGPAAHDVLISLAWSGGLLVVFAFLAARTYARMGR